MTGKAACICRFATGPGIRLGGVRCCILPRPVVCCRKALPAMNPASRKHGTLARQILLAGGLLLGGLLLHPAGWAATGAKNFDHLTTGFNLTGQHESVRCEDCHVRGVFKGTPKQCDACHTKSGAFYVAQTVTPSPKHIPVTGSYFALMGTAPTAGAASAQPCDSCHTTATFYGAHFPHSDVKNGTCINCHNGNYSGAAGKTSSHLATTVSCDVCHTSISFLTAYVAVPIGHIPTSEVCATCHAPTAFVPGSMNHAGTAGACNLCHAAAANPIAFQIPGTITSGGTTVTLTTTGSSVVVNPMSQGGVPNSAAVLPVNHIPTSASCDQCHSTLPPTMAFPFVSVAGFKNGIMKHAAVAGASCGSCHNVPTVFAGTGLGAGGQPFQMSGAPGTPGVGNHIPVTGVDCGACHAVSDVPTATGTGFATKIVPALSVAGHAAVTAANLPCASCHAVGMTWKLESTTMVTATAAHIPPDNTGATIACSSCHSATSVGTLGFVLPGTPGTLTPKMTVAMHAAATAAGVTCDQCHEAGLVNFQGVLGQIYLRPETTSPGLSKAPPLDPYHATTNAATQDCSACHTTSSLFTTATLPSNHFKLNPASATACADCHTVGYGAGLSIMKHADVNTLSCTSCHNTATAFAGTGQGSGGQPWQMSGAVGVLGASTTHFPLGAATDCSNSGCHTSPPTDAMSANGVGFQFATTNPVLSSAGHTTVNAACGTCHAAGMGWKGVATLVGASAAHIPPDNAGASITCNACHASTYSAGAFVLPGTVNTSAPKMTVAMHATVASAVASCDACHEAGLLSFQGVLGSIMLRPNFGANSGASLAVDLAHVGSAATAECNACRSTAPPMTNVAAPANHFKLNPTGTACNDCHAGGYSVGQAIMKHADVNTFTSTSCHNVATAFAGTAQGTGGQPWQMSGAVGVLGTGTTHFPLGAATDCSNSGCHTSPPTDTMSANGVGFQVATTNPVLYSTGHTTVNAACGTCHAAGMSWRGDLTLVEATGGHMPP